MLYALMKPFNRVLLGGTSCMNGRHVSCLFENEITERAPSGSSPEEIEAVRQCVRRHEEEWWELCDCPPPGNRPDWVFYKMQCPDYATFYNYAGDLYCAIDYLTINPDSKYMKWFKKQVCEKLEKSFDLVDCP